MRLGNELPAADEKALQRLNAPEGAQRIDRGRGAINRRQAVHDAQAYDKNCER